jgi:hypothetical protein
LLDDIAERHVAGSRSSRTGICRGRPSWPDCALTSRHALCGPVGPSAPVAP